MDSIPHRPGTASRLGPQEPEHRLEKHNPNDGQSQDTMCRLEPPCPSHHKGYDHSTDRHQHSEDLNGLVRSEPEQAVLPGTREQGDHVRGVGEGLDLRGLVTRSIGEEEAGNEDGQRHEEAEGEGEQGSVPNEVVTL